MPKEVVGNIAYELIYKSDPPLTDAQTEALADEWALLGLRYKKSKWGKYNCLIIGSSRLRVGKYS